jgi:hypothetical protein
VQRKHNNKSKNSLGENMKNTLIIKTCLFIVLAALAQGLSAYKWTVVNKLSQDADIELNVFCAGKNPKATIKSGEHVVIKGKPLCCLNTKLKVNGKTIPYKENVGILSNFAPGQSADALTVNIGKTGLICGNQTFYLVGDISGNIYAARENSEV